MKLEYLKTQLLLKGSSGIGDIFIEDPRITATDQSKTYPYVIWDLKSLKSNLAWQNSAQISEKIKIKAYIIGSYDRRAQGLTQTIEQKWDTLREFFRAYLVVLNGTSYIKVDNFNDMPNELFDIGLSPDGEIGVSFDAEMTLYCNRSITAIDIDGNIYTSAIIGTQEWLVENLKTTKFKDGTAIPDYTGYWGPDGEYPEYQGIYCYYDLDIANKPLYGAMYNWRTINNPLGLAPEDWRIPSIVDWKILFAYTGGHPVAGGKLKEIGLTRWNTPNGGATDEYGFKAVGGGMGFNSGTAFQELKDFGQFWASDEYNAAQGNYVELNYTNGDYTENQKNKNFALSVRCMRDI